MMIISNKSKSLKTIGKITKHFITQTLFLIVLFGFSLQGTLADEANNRRLVLANQLVSKMIKDVEVILAQDSNDHTNRVAKITNLFDTYFDLPSLTKFSVGPYWRAADATEKIAYEKIIRDVIINTVVRNFDRLAGLEFQLLGSQAKGKQLVRVNGLFVNKDINQPTVSVAWRVITRKDTPPLILDVEIENISMLVTQKQENIAIIRKNEGNFSALIEAMQQRSQP